MNSKKGRTSLSCSPLPTSAQPAALSDVWENACNTIALSVEHIGTGLVYAVWSRMGLGGEGEKGKWGQEVLLLFFPSPAASLWGSLCWKITMSSVYLVHEKSYKPRKESSSCIHEWIFHPHSYLLKHIKSNVICHMLRCRPYGKMLTYKPLTNNADKETEFKKRFTK